MEVCAVAEVFEEENGDPTIFHHNAILLRKGTQYYHAISYRRDLSASEVDPAELDLIPIPAAKISPPFPSHFTRAPEPLPQNSYVKRPFLLDYRNTDAYNEFLCNIVLNEAQVCEILRKFPHPNIVRYLGCMVENGRITGLCFVKYEMTLSEWETEDARPLDIDSVLRGVEEGIQHLHSLGLIHCDINPSNILMDSNIPVIGDFDSCQRTGEKLGLKAGTTGWTRNDFKFARPENDEYGLSKVREFLEDARASWNVL